MNKMEELMMKFLEDNKFKFEQSTLKYIQFNVEELVGHSEKSIQEIQARDIRNWLNQLIAKGYAEVTVNTKFFRVKRFFNYCFEEEMITKNPFWAIPNPVQKHREKPPRYLTVKQLGELRNLVEGRVLQRTVVEVLYTTGVRISELCAMKIEDINWSERSIVVKKGKGKKDRLVLFTKDCEEYLKTYLKTRTGDFPFLFLNRCKDGPIKRYSIGDWFIQYSKELGFRVTPHTLRHTFATHLAIKGMSLEYIQALLGHEEWTCTKVYVQFNVQARKELYDEWM
ncbi:tyrosine-type recombinase/integrase [Peribacillus sp. NPDC097197]|uniref:tyrosine-type recombinase/integrase n=1 Tax=Peribacillus sp. NPDC097197 TaxID=3390615 RepID=UPI003CFCD7B9